MRYEIVIQLWDAPRRIEEAREPGTAWAKFKVAMQLPNLYFVTLIEVGDGDEILSTTRHVPLRNRRKP